MTTNFHVGSDGELGRCRAQKGNCPFLNKGFEHFSNIDEAINFQKVILKEKYGAFANEKVQYKGEAFDAFLPKIEIAEDKIEEYFSKNLLVDSTEGTSAMKTVPIPKHAEDMKRIVNDYLKRINNDDRLVNFYERFEDLTEEEQQNRVDSQLVNNILLKTKSNEILRELSKMTRNNNNSDVAFGMAVNNKNINEETLKVLCESEYVKKGFARRHMGTLISKVDNPELLHKIFVNENFKDISPNPVIKSLIDNPKLSNETLKDIAASKVDHIVENFEESDEEKRKFLIKILKGEGKYDVITALKISKKVDDYSYVNKFDSYNRLESISILRSLDGNLNKSSLMRKLGRNSDFSYYPTDVFKVDLDRYLRKNKSFPIKEVLENFRNFTEGLLDNSSLNQKRAEAYKKIFEKEAKRLLKT